MLCNFIEIQAVDAEGFRRFRCSRCKLTTAPTRSPAERVFAECRLWDGTLPGDVLAEILSAAGATEKADCGCESNAMQMNRWGIDGCIENRDVIISWLKAAAQKTGAIETLKVSTYLMRQPWFNPLDPYGSIFERVVSQAASRRVPVPKFR